MASVGLESNTEGGDPGSNGEHVVAIAWDASVQSGPLGHGWDAEPLVLGWFGSDQSDLLVTASGTGAGRNAWIHRRIPVESSLEILFDAGERVVGLDGLRSLCAIPNSGPTRFDLVGLDDTGLIFLPNQGDSEGPRFGERTHLGIDATLGLGPCRVVQVIAVDWDGDGLVDLVASIEMLEGYWPDEDRIPLEQNVGFNQNGGHPAFDAKGAWRGALPTSRIVWLRNVGQPGEPRFELQPEEIEGDEGPLNLALNPAALTVAWGGGGSPELLSTDRRGVLKVYRNFGGQKPPVLMEPRILKEGGAPLVLPDERTTIIAADLDGDRRPELIFGTSSGRVFMVKSGASRNEARSPRQLQSQHQQSELWLAGHSVVTALDFDADGDLDLVFGDAAGHLHALEDKGDAREHRYAHPVQLEGGGIPFQIEPGPDGLRHGPIGSALGYACPLLTDWTGNGRPDLLVGGAGGEVVVLRNDGAADAPRFGLPTLLQCDGVPLIGPPRVRPATADWEGSGELDLISLNLQGFLCVYPREGTLNVGPPVPLVDRLGRLIRLDGAFGQSGLCSLWAGDWSGEGHIDILVGLPRSNRHVVAACLGIPLVNLDDLSNVLLLQNQGNGTLIPRQVRHADGSPLVLGLESCSPSGIAGGDSGLDLLAATDSGHLHLLHRSQLRW